MTLTAAQQTIQYQRQMLEGILSAPLRQLSLRCAEVWDSGRSELNHVLKKGMNSMPYSRTIYVMDTSGQQISDTVERSGDIVNLAGKDRSHRPYFNRLPTVDFLLSESYISEHTRKPSITAVQIIRVDHKPVGFVGVSFDLRDLPLTATLYEEPTCWRQLKGDPSIRGSLFYQQRTESVLDQHIHDVMAVINELITERGIFHADIHFSSNRAMIWPGREPCKYHILSMEDLMDTDVCLAYEKMAYPVDAAIPAAKIERILNSFVDLRFADETIYLRIGSINIHNGIVGMTFSCDGSHYMHYEEFLGKSLAFWIGEAQAGTSTIP